MKITAFLGTKKSVVAKLKKQESLGDTPEARKFEMEQFKPEPLEDVIALTQKVNKELYKTVKIFFKDPEDLKRFKEVSRVFHYPEETIVFEDNQWLQAALEQEYKKKNGSKIKIKVRRKV